MIGDWWRKKFIIIAFEEGDVPLDVAAEAFVEKGGFGGAGVEYLKPDLAAFGEEAEEGGVVLDGMGYYNSQLFQGFKFSYSKVFSNSEKVKI